MKKFIRIDEKGTWKGVKHISTSGDLDYGKEENGISCYCLDDPAYAVDRLRHYWFENAALQTASEYEDMQITIFEGEKVDGVGADMEDMAVCTKTIAEFDAAPFMKKLFDAYMDYYCEDITEDEYNKIITDLVKDWVS